MNSVNLFTVIVFSVGIATVIPFADAYTLHDCSFNHDTITVKALGNLTQSYEDQADLAMANWNNVGTDIFFDKQSSGSVDVELYEFDEASGPHGKTDVDPTCLDGTGGPITHPSSWQVSIGVNDDSFSSFSEERMMATWSHEFGHSLGLNHNLGSSTNESATNMKPTNTSYVTYGIFYPVLDDIRAVDSLYGSPSSTSQCNTSTQSGTVTYTGGACSAGNPRLPMMETVTTADSGNHAFAYDATTSLPSVGTILINTIVDPQTTYRFSMGVHTNIDVSDGGSRYGTVEITNGEIQTAHSFLGFTQTNMIDSTNPSTAKDYWIQLVMRDGEDASAHAYENNGGGTTEPAYLGFATFTPSGSWSGTKYTGTGVWTDNGGNPASDYDIESYNNRQKSET